MIPLEDEFFLWEDLKNKLSHLLGVVNSGRSEFKETWNEDTPHFDHLENILDDASKFIETRLNDLENIIFMEVNKNGI